MTSEHQDWLDTTNKYYFGLSDLLFVFRTIFHLTDRQAQDSFNEWLGNTKITVKIPFNMMKKIYDYHGFMA